MIGILGGGLTGLTIASQLKNKCEVLEMNNECGGLCRSFKENGFTFDYGGAHIIYSRNDRPVEFMLNQLGYNYERHRRNNKIYYKGKFIKYPFENGIGDLDLEDRVECLYHYVDNPYNLGISFNSWIYHTFGKWLAEEYLIPYNEKVWNYDTTKMSQHWVEGRVPKPPVRDVIRAALGIPTEGYTHQLYFYYPKRGGIQALTNSLVNQIPNIRTGFTVHKLFPSSCKFNKCNTWKVSNSDYSELLEYDKIVSTIPAFSLIESLDSPKPPRSVKSAIDDLKFNSLITVMIGIDAPNINDYTAIYFPDKDFLPNRVAFPMNFSSENTPVEMSSLVAEITTHMNGSTWKMTDDTLIDHVVSGLHTRKIIDRESVVYAAVRRSKYAYVIYDYLYPSTIKTIKNYLDSLGIISCGRFAEFEYLNMDDCVSRALSVAEGLINGMAH